MEKRSDKLATRKLLKGRKPSFLRQDGHKKVKLGDKWRKPKGTDNKMRLKLRGYRRLVTKGWKSPKAVRGLSAGGLEIVPVYSKTDIAKIDSPDKAALIGSSVGRKKRLEMLKVAIEKKITVLNVKDPAGYIKQAQDEMAAKAQTKKKKVEEKKKEAEKPKKEEKKTEKEPATIEDKLEEQKKQEKKKKDEILTQKT